MASKIHTDDPKHHKYVVVNKVERKKEKRMEHHRLSFLVRVLNYARMDGWWTKNYHFHFRPHNIKPYHTPGTLIVWDDCNHETYRVIKKGKFVKTSFYGVTKHFKRNPYYGYV